MGQRICSVTDCGRPLVKPHGRGMCNLHYQRWRKHGDPNYILVRTQRQGVEKCVIEGCDKVIKGRDWCAAHYSRWQRHGSPTARLPGQVVDGKRICSHCGVDRPLDEYSSPGAWCRPCQRAVRAEWRKANPQPPKVDEIRPCDHCGAWYPANGQRPRHCSTECSRAGKNKANWVHLNARRARMRNAFVEKFDRLEIFERDGWICGICGEPIDPEVAHPDPRSASLDHVTPISRGGKHSRANAQASHFLCNMRKADSLP